MSDAPEGTTDSAVDTGAPVEAAGTSGPEETSSYDPSTGGDNPAWAPYKEILKDGVYYEAVKPLLREQDLQVNKRFETLRNEYKPLEQYKGLDIPAERIQQVMPIMDMLDNDPVQFFELFKQHPAIAPLLAQAAPAEADPFEPEVEQPGEGSFDITQNPEYQALAQQVQGFTEMMEQQEQQRQAAEVDAQVETEIQTFRQARPDYTDQDMSLLYNTISGQYAATGKLLSFEDASKQLDAYRDSIISAPRPGSAAPRVMPTNGGAPSPNSPAHLGSLSNKETRSLMAGLVDSLKGQS